MAEQFYYVPSQFRRGPRGPRGPAGAAGAAGSTGPAGATGAGSIDNTGNLIQGDGAGAGIDSTILPADVIALVTNNTGTNTGDQTDITGNAGTVTTIPTLSGSVTNVGNEVTLVDIPKEATHETDVMEVSLNNGGWTLYEVTANDAYTGQTLQDIADLVSDELAAGARYEIDARLMFSMSADVTGMKIAIHGSGSGSAATALVVVSGTANAHNNASNFIIAAVDNSTSTTLLWYANALGIIRLQGFVTTRSGGAPTISIQHLKVTSGTSTCLPGSNMRLRKCNF